MRKSIATVSLSGMLREKLEAAAAARFDGVEIFENDLLQFAGSPRDVRRIAEDLGLAIDMYQPFRDFDGADAAQLRRNLDRAARKFDLMHELGTNLLLVCSSVQPSSSAEPERLAEQMRRLAEEAGARGIRLAYEALAWGAHVNRFAQAWEVVRLADHPHLGLALDSFHTLVLRDDPAPLEDIPGDRIFFMQLADAPWVRTDVLTHSRHFRCFPGQGEFDVTRFVSAALAAGYTGPLSLEIFNDDFRAAPARRIAADAMRSLLWLEERLRVRAQAQAIAPRVPLFDPPPAPVLHGWGFVEFAVDGPTATRLRDFLISTGFARIGRHRSKDVALFGLGDVRVVLNSEDESFARSYFELHGTSACAVALETSDAVGAMARAEGFGCQRVDGRVGPNELTLPAVRAPDGGLMYFLDARHGGTHGFERDFEPDGDAPPAVGDGARIDHVAQVLPVGQLDTWVLFYRAVLGLSPVATTVLNDPYGVVRSRAVESADGSVRYALNVSDRSETAVARSVSSFRGAGVHHVAVAVGDVVAMAALLRERGAPVLPIPANYYDDLAAKFALDEAFVEALRAHHVLYDRDADGEYLHVYTAPFDGRFHFEFIERRGRYAQYGQANAPTRLAAMAEWRARAASRADADQ